MNPHLLKDLVEGGHWDETMMNQLIAHNGSVQNIGRVPKHLKELYRTVWELPQKVLLLGC